MEMDTTQIRAIVRETVKEVAVYVAPQETKQSFWQWLFLLFRSNTKKPQYEPLPVVKQEPPLLSEVAEITKLHLEVNRQTRKRQTKQLDRLLQLGVDGYVSAARGLPETGAIDQKALDRAIEQNWPEWLR